MYRTYVGTQIEKAEKANGKPLTVEQYLDAAAGGLDLDPANKQKVKDAMLSLIDGQPSLGLKRSDLVDTNEKKALLSQRVLEPM